MPQAIKIAIIAAFFLLTRSYETPAQEISRAAAVVNDDIVSMLDVKQRLQLLIVSTGQKDSPELRQRMLTQVVRGLIDERLQAQEAERLDIRVADEQIEAAFDNIAEQNKMSKESFLKALENSGILLESFKDQVRAQLTWQALIARRIRPSTLVSEDEVEDAIRRVRANRGTTLRKISEIFLSVDNPDQEEEIRGNAERIYEQLRANTRFGALARQFSQSATAPREGEVGWVQKGQLPVEIDRALETMEPGQVSKPIRTLAGFHIVWLREERQSAAGEVTLELKQLLFALPANPSAAQRQDALARAQSVRTKVTGCQNVDSLAQSVGSPGSGSLGKMKLADLPPEIQQAVGGLSNGQASEPIALPAGISVLVVCDREDSGIDRDRIRQRLSEERLSIQARKFMRNLRLDANVDIRI
jgi:peptidyl-prolyl cis-trans isomerase SurA